MEILTLGIADHVARIYNTKFLLPDNQIPVHTYIHTYIHTHTHTHTHKHTYITYILTSHRTINVSERQ